MEHASSTSAGIDFFRVQTATQAELFSDPVAVKFLEPFLGRERSASQAAAELGVAIDTLLYRVNKFLDAGLLEIVRLEPRAGRPIKIYRTIADGFYVPFALTGFAEHEEQMRELLRADEDVIVAAASRMRRAMREEGQRIFRAADGEVWHQSSGDEGKSIEWGDFSRMHTVPGPAFETFGSEVWLTDGESKDFLIELYELYLVHRSVSDANREAGRGREFLFRFQLAAHDD